MNVESGNLLKSKKEIKGFAKADVKNDCEACLSD